LVAEALRSLPHRPLGSSGIDVSLMALGSWRTFERIAREDGVAVMRAARDVGIDFLDDARYDDETGAAPIPTGYSEVVFGELFRAAGWGRDDVTIANKLWWEHWPEEGAVAELDGSLGRMRLDHVDLIYAIAPPPSLPVADVVAQVARLLESGRARAWGTGMWSAAQLVEAIEVCAEGGVPPPVAAQMACSLAEHAQASDPAMRATLSSADIGLVASYVLAGGTLTGKYLHHPGTGRATDDDSPVIFRGKELAAPLTALAAEWGVEPTHLAFCYALDHPNLATVLFGATSPEQVRTNVEAVDVYASLDREQLDAIHALAA
jgi:aryl-alcohol dehydrogenase-like predicted oxidoreductase